MPQSEAGVVPFAHLALKGGSEGIIEGAEEDERGRDELPDLEHGRRGGYFALISYFLKLAC